MRRNISKNQVEQTPVQRRNKQSVAANHTPIIQLQKKEGFYFLKENATLINDSAKKIKSINKGTLVQVINKENKESKFKADLFKKQKYSLVQVEGGIIGWVNDNKLDNDPVGSAIEEPENELTKGLLNTIFKKRISLKEALINNTKIKGEAPNDYIYELITVGEYPEYTNTSLTTSGKNNDLDFLHENYFPQSNEKTSSAITTLLELIKGDYFHNRKRNSNITANKRMIINPKTQQIAFDLADIIDDQLQHGILSSFVREVKFYASNKKNENVIKHDKIVIYYDDTTFGNEEILQEIVKETLQKIEKNTGENDLLDERITPFYTKIGDGIAIGKEIPGTSFSDNRTEDIIEFLQTFDHDNMDKEEFSQYLLEYIQERIDTSETDTSETDFSFLNKRAASSQSAFKNAQDNSKGISQFF